ELGPRHGIHTPHVRHRPRRPLRPVARGRAPHTRLGQVASTFDFRLSTMPDPHDEPALEIAICGDLTEHENDISEKLLAVHPGGECVLYFNSPGGSADAALALASV